MSNYDYVPDYDEMVRNLLGEMNIEITDEQINFILNRLKMIDNMVVILNGKREGNHLRSTQVIAKIVFDCLQELHCDSL